MTGPTPPSISASAMSSTGSTFKTKAVGRGCTHAFVTPFTFQAPAFYRRLGYEEIVRRKPVPTPGRDDVHLRKDLGQPGIDVTETR
ncbi:hypothetical protein ENKNEFLB_03926 [Nocardioides aquaticus]|uniref:GNAT family N-acetyltransferase n=1 Tax=Nocardioides aquaticus TaxID=160826 RepID=A0ABX8ELY7_9ACTN|nr:hypothetical protein [Nocardioides aquaticus]QVT81516.1 hypothetical protein ENKNEFLB_03926 [Nocardioides aquaticus]